MKKKIAILLGLSFAAFSMRADPLNEDEAYDPTDWFDGNNYEYDDTLNLDVTGPNDGYYDYQAGNANTWYDTERDEPAYDRDSADPGYASDPSVRDYGWHQQWNPASNQWESDYGWHRSQYDDVPEQDDTRILPDRRQPGSMTARNSAGQNRAQKSIRGIVQHVQTLTLRDRTGADRRHAIAKVNLRDGRSFLVDFGEKQQNLRLQIDAGEEVQISGNVGRISGRRVLFASSARVDGRNYTVQRQNRTQSRNRIASISGTVQDVAPIYLNNEAGRTKRFVKLSLQNGKMHLVDLGQVRAADIGLTEGERVTLRGYRDQISGREFIRASRITVNGETKDLNNTNS